MFLPWRLDAQVKLAPRLTVEAIEALRWASGQGPLDSANARTYRFQAPTVPWVTWTPGEPGEATFGGGFTGADVRQVAREVEKGGD